MSKLKKSFDKTSKEKSEKVESRSENYLIRKLAEMRY